jgi:2-methylcitrate dehydratase PrpD
VRDCYERKLTERHWSLELKNEEPKEKAGKMTNVTHTLAEFVTNLTYENIPKNAIECAKTCILDLFGSAFAAVGSPIAIAAGAYSEGAFGNGEVTRWDTGRKTSLLSATWVNSVLGSAIDIDDGHRLAVGHPGSSIIPAAVAVAEKERVNGKQLLEAAIAGYEVGIRVSSARDPQRIENVATGAWGGFGAAIGASKLLFDSVQEIENTLGLVAMYTPRLPGTFPGGRGMVKEGIPWAAVAGVSAALLTRSGFTGPRDLFEHSALYQSQKLLDGLGSDFLILKTYFKRYPCCRWLHPIIEGCLAFMDDGDFQVPHIRKIRIQTFSRAFGLPNRARPKSLEEAQFSIPFCSALAMLKSEEGFYHIREEDLNDSNVVSLSEKVVLEHHPGFDEAFPEKIVSRITIETSKGRVEKVVSSAQGDPDNPFSREELQEKYLRYSSPVLGDKKAILLMEHLQNLEDISVEEMMKIVRSRNRNPSKRVGTRRE